MSDREGAGRTEEDLPGQLWELWRQGLRPDVGVFLASAPTVRPETLVAILRVDQQHRWLSGERVPAETYLAAYPCIGAAEDLAVELIYCEYLLREELGESPPVEEYVARFPAYQKRLREQIEVHLALGGVAGLATRLTAAGGESVADSQATRAPGPGEAATPLEVPGYEILREVGRGGMGVVYEARDRRTGKRQALKVMQRMDAAGLYRFKQEFRTLAGLSHPNLVSLYELCADGQVWFFTMELIDGEGFLTHVRGPSGRGKGGLSRAAADRLRAALGQLADGVHFLHAAGKLHRDIKPGNVLVTRQERVVLLDFGLAAEMDRTGQHLSLQPRLLGTIGYMAPEQAACQPVSPAADWYAVGAMLFEALTGRLPFTGGPMEVLLLKQQRDAPSPRDLVPDAPEDLSQLCQALLRRDPAARPTGMEVRRQLGGSPFEAVGPVTTEVPLVGRREHLEQLAGAFARTRQGRTVVVSVHGRSGAGKSALLRHFLDDLERRDQAVVLSGRCYEQESVPYKALDSLVDALSRYLEGLPRLEVEALLPRDVAPLARLFPVLRQVEAVADAPRRLAEASDPGEVRRRALTGLRELLARLGDRRPLVLAIDDLQWGDEDSSAVLAELLLPPEPPVFLLLASFRSEDVASSPCLGAFGRIGGEGGLDRVDLPVAPLSEEERRELAQALLGDRGPSARLQTEVIARQSGGFPFFIHELARFLRDGRELRESGGPAGDITLGGVLWERIQRLPTGSRRLLEVVAAAGRPLSVTEAAAAAGVEDAAGALAQLRNERLARTAAGQTEQIETYHDRIREAIVLHLPAEVQAEHHRRLAEVLEATEAEPEWKAMHWLGAGQPARAGQYFAQAAERAAAALAFDRAAKMYRQALALQDLAPAERRRLSALLGDALTRAGRGAEAAREYLAAAEGAEPALALDLRRKAALVLLSSGHVDQGLSTLRDVLASVGLAAPSTPARTFWALVWQRVKLRLRGLGFARRTEREVPATDLMRLDVCKTAAVGLSMVDTIQGTYFQSRSLLLALRAGEPSRLVSALALEGAHESIDGPRSRARTNKLFDAAERLARDLGEPYPLAMVSLCRGAAAALEGDWRRGQVLCDRAESIFREACTGVMWELGTAHRFSLWPLIYMGELTEAANRLPGLIQEARERDDLYEETNLCLIVRTFLRLAADEPARAREELQELMARWSHDGFHVQHMSQMFDEVQIDLYEGKCESAWEHIAAKWRLLERSQLLRIQQIRIKLTHLRGRAALAARKGDAALFQARALRREGVGWARALGRLLEAGAACRSGSARANDLLAEAARLCDAAGMRLYAASARLLLGQRLGGEEGRSLATQAAAWMKEQKVARPERMAAMLAPGIG